MKMMNLDIAKMRRLSLSGIDVSKLAPNLFDNEHSEYAFAQKQGGTLDWYLPDFDKSKRKQQQTGNLVTNERDQLDSKKMIVSENKLQFTCHLNTIIMGDLGEIGWYLKLESIADKNNKNP